MKVAPAAGADRLSNLPVELLYAVMSLLPAWQAVQTCVLSKKCRDFWRTMPCLHLDERLHLDARRLNGHRSVPMFENFASNLLLLHEATSLDGFRIVVTSPSDHRVQGWIRYAVTRRPVVLEIQNRHPWLEIHELALPSMDYSHYFGRFRSLQLCRVRIDGRFAEKLRSGCWPVLEDLELERCLVELSKITLPVVKNLTIRACEKNNLLIVTASALSCQGRNAILLGQAAASPAKAPIYHRCIGSLRKLHLRDVQLSSCFAENFRSYCPVLEDLELRFCHPKFFKITLPAVTNLTIYFCKADLLIITAPSLMYLSCEGNTIMFHDTTASLVKAFISLPVSVKMDIQRKLLGSLFNATSLYLSDLDTLVRSAILKGSTHFLLPFNNINISRFN